MRSPAGPGRPAKVPLAAPPTRDSQGRAVGEVAGLFEEWLEVSRDAGRVSSPRTVDGYRADMARWATLLAPPGLGSALDRWTLRDLTSAAVQRALVAMEEAGLSVAARNRALAPLRGLCGWLRGIGRLDREPTATIAVAGQPPGEPRPLRAFSAGELRRIVDVVAAGRHGQRDGLRWPTRDVAALSLLVGCGLRVGELCALTWAALGDLDGHDASVRVVGRGGRERHVPLGANAASALQRYRDELAALHDRPAVIGASPVIVRRDGTPVTASALAGWVTSWLRAAQVDRRRGALVDAFRLTAVEAWLAGGATVADVQALLGQTTIPDTGVRSAIANRLATVVSDSTFETVLPRAPAAPRR